MPAVMEAIDRMTTSEKLETMDYLVSSISSSGDTLSPAWHERELKKTEARVASGIEHPILWPVGTDILERICESMHCNIGDIVDYVPDEPADKQEQKK